MLVFSVKIYNVYILRLIYTIDMLFYFVKDMSVNMNMYAFGTNKVESPIHL